jgi:prolyl-tRNA synthetase
MGCTYLDQQGKAQAMVMGCYGIGVTRLLGAAIEQGHDERGIIWPISMAPFEVVICPMNYDRSELVKATADQLHDELLKAGIDVILDDRGERPGAMFADWELIGAPFRVVIGDRGLVDSVVEFKGRTDEDSQNVALANIKAKVITAVQAAKNSIQ